MIMLMALYKCKKDNIWPFVSIFGHLNELFVIIIIIIIIIIISLVWNNANSGQASNFRSVH